MQIRRIVLTVLLLTAGLTGCTQAEQTQLTVGAVLPMTGTNARHGELARRGIELALDDGNKLDVVYKDSQFDPGTAVTAYNQLKRTEEPDAVLALGSPVGMALAPKAQQHKTPLLSVAAAPPYSKQGSYVYRIVGSANVEAQTIIQIITQQLDHRRIGILYIDNDYGAGTKNAFVKTFRSTNRTAEIVGIESFSPDDRDMRSQLTKLSREDPDVIFVPSLGGEAGLVIKQARELGIEAGFICAQACQNEDLIGFAGDAAEGAYVVAPTDDANPGYAQEYRERYNESPDFVSMRFYDAANILQHLAERCAVKTDTRHCIKRGLDQLEGFPGVSYSITFDQHGDINDRFVLKQVRNGSFQRVQ